MNLGRWPIWLGKLALALGLILLVSSRVHWVVGLVLGMLVLGELIAWAFGRPGRDEDLDRFLPCPDARIYRQKPNLRFSIRYANRRIQGGQPEKVLDYQLNRDGFHDRDFLPRNESAERIVALGDSATLGEGVKMNDAWPRCLETLLRRGGRAAEVLNLGVSGYNTVQEAALLRNLAPRLKPKLVVLLFTMEDLVLTKGIHVASSGRLRRRGVTTGFRLRTWLSRRSRLWAWAHFLYYKEAAPREFQRLYNRGGRPFLAWREAIHDIAGTCQKVGADLLFVIYPVTWRLGDGYPFHFVHRAAAEACAEEAIPCLDLQEAFSRNHRGPDLWVHPTDGHPNREAHAIIATEVAKAIHAMDPACSHTIAS